MLSGTVLFAASIVSRYSFEDTVEIVALVILSACLIMVFAALLAPSIAIHQDKHYPAVRGFFNYKNVAGRVLLLGIMSGLTLVIAKRRTVGFIVCISSLCMTIATLSTTAMVGAALIFGAFLATFILKKGKFAAAAVAAVVVALPVLLLANTSTSELLGIFFDATGKDATLTGRTQIWSLLLSDIIPKRPLLGYGYEAFWVDSAGAASYNWHLGQFIPPHAHNGYLQVLTSIGLVGLFFLSWLLLKFASMSLRLFFTARNSAYLIFSVFFVSYITVNISEPSFVSYGESNFLWIFFCCLSMHAVRLTRQSSGGWQRLRRPPGFE